MTHADAPGSIPGRNSYDMVIDAIRVSMDRPIAFQRAFVRPFGVTGALMLSQSIYWSQRTDDPDGWFWKTVEEWEEETGLTKEQQQTARQRLAPVLIVRRNGMPRRNYFQVDFGALYKVLEGLGAARHASVDGKASHRKMVASSRRETLSPVGVKTAVQSAGKPPTERRESRPHITEMTSETTSETTPEMTFGAEHNAAPPGQRASVMVWDAYSEAYRQRYAVNPVRNAKVNGQIAQLVKRLGADEAPLVAAFYVKHGGAFYIRSGHCVDLLLRDCEKLRTEWATNRTVTETSARQQDRKETNRNIAEQLIEENRNGH